MFFLLILLPRESALVAQLDRAPDYGSGGLGFDSLRACHSRFLFHGTLRESKTRMVRLLRGGVEEPETSWLEPLNVRFFQRGTCRLDD